MIYAAARIWPKSNIRFLSAPIIFGGTGEIPPATPLNYLVCFLFIFSNFVTADTITQSWGIVGFVFNKVIRNRYRGWVRSSALLLCRTFQFLLTYDIPRIH
jgi:hypothetical protein